MLRKAIVLVDAGIDKVLLVFSVIALLVCCYALYDAIVVYYNANDTSVLKYKPELDEGGAALKELSEDAVAWITIDGTKIDYPVMQGKNNTEYVNKDPYGAFSLSGSIFLDSRSSADFTDPYSLLYGHHMEQGLMFGALDDYLQEDFLRAHRTGTLTTTSDDSYDIRIFASMKTQANDKLVFDPPESDASSLMSLLESSASVLVPMAASDNPSAQDDTRIIALSTCTTAESLDRTVVFGTLTKRAQE